MINLNHKILNTIWNNIKALKSINGLLFIVLSILLIISFYYCFSVSSVVYGISIVIIELYFFMLYDFKTISVKKFVTAFSIIILFFIIASHDFITDLAKRDSRGVKIAILVMLILAIMIITVGGIQKRYKSIERTYLAMVIPLSIVYLLLFLPWNHPDESAHFLATYRFSNLVMGYAGDMEWFGRADDVKFFREVWRFDPEHFNPSLETYNNVINSTELFCVDNSMVEFGMNLDHMKFYSIINYLPEVIGITIGRLINLGTVPMIYLARILLLTIYIAFTYRAISKTPVGKSAMIVSASIPMSIMMSSAFSYDPIVLVCTLCFISCVFRLKNHIGSKVLILETMIWAFCLGSVKGGGYLILLPLSFCIIEKINLKNSIKKAFLIIGAGLFSVYYFNKVLTKGLELFQFGEIGTDKYTTSFALDNPLKFLGMCLNTYLTQIDFYADSLGGVYMGWLENIVPHMLIFTLFFTCVILSSVEIDSIKLEKKELYLIVLIILISIVATPAMLLKDTLVGSKYIAGIQGRYYLPVFPLMIYFLTKFSPRVIIDNNKSYAIQNKIIELYSFVSMVVVYYLLRVYLMR